MKNFQPNEKNVKYENRICLEKFSGFNLGSKVMNRVEENEKRELNSK